MTLLAPAATMDGLAEACAHCGQPAFGTASDPSDAATRRFCCPGCAAAFAAIQALGLGSYYERRIAGHAPPPERSRGYDLSRFIVARADGTKELTLAIDGLRCGACVWLIELVLAREPVVRTGRVNMTTRRLRLVWDGAEAEADRLVARVETFGYRLVPFDPMARARDDSDRVLMRALAVAGFAAINVMLLSIGVWSGEATGLLAGMRPATRDLLHWVSALIALPAIAFAGRPFFRPAFAALRRGRTNMDVPISLGVVLVTGLSLAQTLTHGHDTYFDSAVMLLFFLLIGRVLDHRARGHVRSAAELLLMLRASDVTVLLADGTTVQRPTRALSPGDRLLIGLGERVGADGIVETGESLVDASLVTGESLPAPISPGSPVFAGALNLGAPLTLRVTATEEGTLLAECTRLIEVAEARRSHFVVLADRVARRYAPTVHLAAAMTFIYWYFLVGAPPAQSLLTACAVLIITCPCALALAVPAVQVIATARLFRAGVLLKSGTALERLAGIDTVIFDKTGTLTEPTPVLIRQEVDPASLRDAASLAAHSRHPLARALLVSSGPVPVMADAREHPGLGVEGGGMRLGSAAFAGVAAQPGGNTSPELWLTSPDRTPVRFRFAEQPRHDAAGTVVRLRAMGLKIRLLSGDGAGAVARIAAEVDIPDWRASCLPADKAAELRRGEGRALMVGDGLNDGPCLAEAYVSASPATGADVTQTLADMVVQGSGLSGIAEAVATARRARTLMRGNIALSIGYNLLMVPLAAAGYVTPWLAAAAMSGSSLLVIGNSLRAGGGRGERP